MNHNQFKTGPCNEKRKYCLEQAQAQGQQLWHLSGALAPVEDQPNHSPLTIEFQ